MPPTRSDERLAEILQIYEEAELRILKKVADSLKSGMDVASWELDKLLELYQVKAYISGELGAAASEAIPQLARLVEESYGGSEAETTGALIDAGFAQATNAHPVVSNAALVALVQQATTSATPVSSVVMRQVEDVYRKATQGAAAGMILGTDTRDTAVQRALNEYAAAGVTAFTDSRGRKWNLRAYTEMAVGTAAHRASTNGHLDRLQARGENLVVVSDHAGECPLCRPWEGKVLRISGEEITSEKYPTVAEARAAGLEHPGCRHRYSLWMEGISKKPEPQGSPEEYERQQRSHEIDRHVREWERRKVVGDPKAPEKLKYWRSEKKKILEEKEKPDE